jgi:putative transposase
MLSLGMKPVPSPASLARIFRDAGVARLEPKKKPRASWRRFVYPAPNACWQLDATEYVLTRGRTCVIFQLIDDHARFAVASHVAWGETAEDAVAVVKKGIGAHGVPQRLLSDNGAALNPSRRGVVGQLVTYVTDLGVEAITGKPYKPTTQGKNERFHQTLFRFLDKQPLAETLAELQEQVDRFDQFYNTERPHQGLPGRTTPAQAWEATPKAEAPRPKDPQPRPARDDIRSARIRANGSVKVRQTLFYVKAKLAGTTVRLVEETDTLLIFDNNGTLLIDYPWPKHGTTSVGRHSRNNPELSPMS